MKSQHEKIRRDLGKSQVYTLPKVSLGGETSKKFMNARESLDLAK